MCSFLSRLLSELFFIMSFWVVFEFVGVLLSGKVMRVRMKLMSSVVEVEIMVV